MAALLTYNCCVFSIARPRLKNWIHAGAVLAIVFVATRVPALLVQDLDNGIDLYARYAAESQAASRRGESFYDLHRRRVEEEIHGASPSQAANLAPYKSVEYPPVAITFMRVPAWLLDNPFDEEFPTGPQPRYTRCYVRIMAGLDVVVLLFVVFLVRRLFGTESVYFQHWSRLPRQYVHLLVAALWDLVHQARPRRRRSGDGGAGTARKPVALVLVDGGACRSGSFQADAGRAGAALDCCVDASDCPSRNVAHRDASIGGADGRAGGIRVGDPGTVLCPAGAGGAGVPRLPQEPRH